MKGETRGTTGKKNLSIATKAEPAGKPQKICFWMDETKDIKGTVLQDRFRKC
jgi:hypothetical protein